MSLYLSDQEKLDLKRIACNMDDWEDNTVTIRRLKHSQRIAQDILVFLQLKQQFPEPSSVSELETRARQQCSFLATTYGDIFQKLLRNEINYTILSRVLQYLEMIEEGKVDQLEGSALVGKYLKELYIDSAIRHGEHLDTMSKDTTSSTSPIQGKEISWNEYKQNHNL